MNRKRTIQRIICFLLIALCNAGSYLQAQSSTVWPLKPHAGDSLHIFYNADSTSALSGNSNQKFVKVSVHQQDGGITWHTLSLKGEAMQNAVFRIPEGAASIALRFYTINKDDEGAAKLLYIYQSDTLNPVAGAYFDDMFSPQAALYFQKEVKTYPKHYLAYGKFFNIISLIEPQQSSLRIIDSLLPTLLKAEKAHAISAGLYASVCVAYAKTNRLPAAKPYLMKLFRLFPESEETAFAFSLYNYEFYKSGAGPTEEDIHSYLIQLAMGSPMSAVLRDPNVIEILSSDDQLPVENLERILLPRYQENKVVYHALSQLPEIYLKRNLKPDFAKQMLDEAIGLFESGSIHHQYHLSVSQNNLYTAILYHQLARACIALKRYHDAIQATSTALSLISKTNAEGNFKPKMLLTRAEAFRGAGNLNMAQADYKQLYQMGEISAADSLRNLFPLCTNKEKSVDELLSALVNIKNEKKNFATAPDFTGTDLSGNKVQLSSLKGKIVLLNFWGTGCGPCIVEMPELNKLVKKYEGTRDVVFLALTEDETASLSQFFANKKREFKYTVINQTGRAMPAYQIESLPVHIVIGRNGEIVDRSVGARKDIYNYLDQVISRNL